MGLYSIPASACILLFLWRKLATPHPHLYPYPAIQASFRKQEKLVVSGKEISRSTLVLRPCSNQKPDPPTCISSQTSSLAQNPLTSAIPSPKEGIPLPWESASPKSVAMKLRSTSTKHFIPVQCQSTWPNSCEESKLGLYSILPASDCILSFFARKPRNPHLYPYPAISKLPQTGKTTSTVPGAEEEISRSTH